MLPSITSSEQTTYVKKRFIGEGRRLVSDILSATNNFKIKRYLIIMDIEKEIDSVDRSFLISAL